VLSELVLYSNEKSHLENAMDYICDKFGNILSKDSCVAYVKNSQIERGRVVEAFRVGMAFETVRIKSFNGLQQLVVRPANEVMSVILPAT